MVDNEAQLDRCVIEGTLLNLAGAAPVDRAAMLSWSTANAVSAAAFREIVLGQTTASATNVPVPGTRRAGAAADPRGLRLRGAVIVGRLDLRNVNTDVWLELVDCYLPEGIDVRGARLTALVLKRCRIAARPGAPPLDRPALHGRRMSCLTVVDLSGTVALARTAAGAVDLLGAKLGELDCSEARLGNHGGPALLATRAVIDGNVFLRSGFTALGTGEQGSVNLVAARIGGQVDGTGARIKCRSGAGLFADSINVRHDLLLRGGFRAYGASRNRAAVSLSGAEIGGQLDLGQAVLRNTRGPALRADDLEVDHEMLLNSGFRAVGRGHEGTVRLPGVKIGGQLNLRTANVQNPRGPALVASSANVGRGALMDDRLTLAGTHNSATVQLNGARIAQYWMLAPAGVTNGGRPNGAWSIDGLVYDGVPGGIDFEETLMVLGIGMQSYASQPYQQLAAVHRAAGHDREVRTILIRQRRHQLRSGVLTGWNGAWVRFTGWTLGFGYQPWRALVGLFLVLLFAVSLCLTSGTLRHTRNVPHEGTSCRTAERIQVAFDVAISPVQTPIRTRCEISPTRSGDWLNVTAVVLKFVAWGLTALFAVGFTNAVRKA